MGRGLPSGWVEYLRDYGRKLARLDCLPCFGGQYFDLETEAARSQIGRAGYF